MQNVGKTIRKEQTEAQLQETEDRPAILIAGPCSAETREQVLTIASALSRSTVSYMRAGIWKPRTSPDSFEGVGKEGLEWLQEAKATYGIKIATEVANSNHVELALKYDADLIWVGARTSVNPFAVQEIADALKGVSISVMVKNPINPDLDLWKGAIERIRRAGVKHVLACHRGFNVYAKTMLRNAPLWEIPIELKREFPELPLICDPSHIAGKRSYLKRISQKALNLGYEGLMIETHHQPEKALSDAAQQITPENFFLLLEELDFKTSSSANEELQTMLSFLRTEMDGIDEQLIELLAERMKTSRKIGALKKENHLPFYESSRWSEVIDHCLQIAEKQDLNPDFIRKVLSLIHLESIDIQGE